MREEHQLVSYLYDILERMGPKRSVSQFASKSSILSQSGQGTIEYILLLVVSIGIVALIAFKYFEPLGNFASNYFGEYTRCLLETGELPSLGGVGAVGLCNAEFQPFTIASGRPPSSGNGGSGGNGGGNGGGSENGRGNGSQSGSGNSENGEGSEGGEDELAGSSGGGGRGRGGSRAISESSSSFGSGSSGNGGSAGDERIAANESLLADGNKSKSDSGFGAGGSSRSDNYRGISGRIPVEQEKKKAEAPSKVAAAKAEADQGQNSDPGKIKVADRDIAQKKIEEEEPMGFGKWLRILFIVLIIVAILVFFGLQAVQIAKGWE